VTVVFPVLIYDPFNSVVFLFILKHSGQGRWQQVTTSRLTTLCIFMLIFSPEHTLIDVQVQIFSRCLDFFMVIHQYLLR
jgi:hypothetical protein